MNVAFEWREASRHVDSLYLLYLGNGPDATSNSHNDVIMVPPRPPPPSFLSENLLLMSHKEGVSADLLFILIFTMVGFEQISFDLKYDLFPPSLVITPSSPQKGDRGQIIENSIIISIQRVSR